MLEIICFLTLVIVVLLLWAAYIQDQKNSDYFLVLTRNSPINVGQILERIDERLKDLQERLTEVEEAMENNS